MNQLIAFLKGRFDDQFYAAMRSNDAYALADVESKRRILAIHVPGKDPCDAHDASMRSILCDTVLMLALPFADHPDCPEAQAGEEPVVSNPIYGKPPEGEPIKLLSDAVEVMRPNGSKVVMDLVALAEVAIGTERALAGLREQIEKLSRRVSALENKSGRQERAGRILAGGGEYEEPDEDIADRVRALEQAAERRREDEMERRERE